MIDSLDQSSASNLQIRLRAQGLSAAATTLLARGHWSHQKIRTCTAKHCAALRRKRWKVTSKFGGIGSHKRVVQTLKLDGLASRRSCSLNMPKLNTGRGSTKHLGRPEKGKAPGKRVGRRGHRLLESCWRSMFTVKLFGSSICRDTRSSRGRYVQKARCIDLVVGFICRA